jgi:archaeosine synthase
MIRQLLQSYLKHNPYDHIIIHLPPTIQEFINDLLNNPIITCKDNPLSQESLEKLREQLKTITEPLKKVQRAKRTKENLTALSSYQFGKKTTEYLLKNCEIKGKYPNQKIFYKKTQIGMVPEQRGLLSLTLAGATRLAETGQYCVHIYDDFTLKGSVFAPGVKDAEEDIRIGDEVVVLQNNSVCGVGVALMNGDEMKESHHGEAVRIRHSI